MRNGKYSKETRFERDFFSDKEGIDVVEAAELGRRQLRLLDRRQLSLAGGS